jgi:hypothetical protein
MNFTQGFELWRRWASPATASHVSFAALTAIHYAHRLMAYAVLALLALLAWRLRPAMRCSARHGWLGLLALWQLATGLSNVVLGWPLVAARGAHRRRRGAGRGAHLGRCAKAAGRQPLLHAQRASTLSRDRFHECRTANFQGFPALRRADTVAPTFSCAPVLRADQAARGAADRVLRADRHGAGRARRAFAGEDLQLAA